MADFAELLKQNLGDGGEAKPVMVLRDWVFHHFTKTALIVEDDPETRKKRPKVLKVGIDPHFSFANMLCDLAWARSYGTTTFIMPDTGPTQYESDLAQKMAAAMPGLPDKVLAMVDTAPRGFCGSCTAFEAGRCKERDFGVLKTDPGCFLYDEIERPNQS